MQHRDTEEPRKVHAHRDGRENGRRVCRPHRRPPRHVRAAAGAAQRGERVQHARQARHHAESAQRTAELIVRLGAHRAAVGRLGRARAPRRRRDRRRACGWLDPPPCRPAGRGEHRARAVAPRRGRTRGAACRPSSTSAKFQTPLAEDVDAALRLVERRPQPEFLMVGGEMR